MNNLISVVASEVHRCQFFVTGHRLLRTAVLYWCEDQFGQSKTPLNYGSEGRWYMDRLCHTAKFTSDSDAILFVLQWLGTHEIDWEEASATNVRRERQREHDRQALIEAYSRSLGT